MTFKDVQGEIQPTHKIIDRPTKDDKSCNQ